ncbi:helix-turn-helix domain-containing protein [Dankookia sp. GCM10030260]|uniref:AraC family transcriptional regulator n=1 Tax=Dankookia sp. GCM10030260 TaxID=3273390 RepID=UPI003605BA78
MRRYPFLLQTRDLDLSGLTLQLGRSTPLGVIGAVPPATAWLLLPLDGAESLLLRGRGAAPCGIAAFGDGAEFELANRSDASWGLIALPAAEIGPAFSPPRFWPMRHAGAAAWWRAKPGAWMRAAALMQDAAEVMAQDPDVFEVEEARRSLRASVLDAGRDLLGDRLKEARYRPPGAAMPSLRRIVRAVDDYLVAHSTQGLDPVQVSMGLGVAETQLRAAFLTILGISATRYLMVRRLLLVRAALRAADSDGETVERTAATHGFWSLRRLERAYRALFGETPAECRNRSRNAARPGPSGGD